MATLAVNFLVLTAALYVIISKKYGPKTQEWAFRTVALILGYWLK
jgi:hypothetical protein